MPSERAAAQSQASVTEQLARLHVLAVQHGLYNAADWITRVVEDRSPAHRVAAYLDQDPSTKALTQ